MKVGYLYILLTVILTTYGQLVLKWRMTSYTEIPSELVKKFQFLFFLVFDPYIFSSFAAAFLASLTWMAALTKFELSHAYPFMSASFFLVLIASYFLLNEPLNVNKVVGTLLIIGGVIFIGIGSK